MLNKITNTHRMHRILFVALGFTAFAQFAHADLVSGGSDGSINFTGGVTAQTCSIAVNGGGSQAAGSSSVVSLTLPTVSSNTLSGTPGATKGNTEFNFNLSGCTTTTGMALVYFESGPTVLDDGTLKNTHIPISGAEVGASLQIVDANNNAVVIGDPSQLNGPAQALSDKMLYSARYVAESSVVGAGVFETSVTYSIAYK